MYPTIPYDPHNLLNYWLRGQMTKDMAIGQVLQHIAKLLTLTFSGMVQNRRNQLYKLDMTIGCVGAR